MKYWLKTWQWQAEVHTHWKEYAAVEELTLNQEVQPQTHYLTRQTARRTGLCQSTVVRITHHDLGLKICHVQELSEAIRYTHQSRQVSGWRTAMISILSPVYYNIWDIIQQRVYQTKVHDVNDLKQHLIAVWARTKRHYWRDHWTVAQTSPSLHSSQKRPFWIFTVISVKHC